MSRAEALFLERGREEDLETLLDLEQRAFSHPWTAGSLRAALTAGGSTLFLVLRAAGGSGPGRGIRAYCVLETVLDEAQVHDLVVHPDHRRGGLGGRLLRLALGIAADRGAETAHLEVRASNWPALALYRSAGFEVAGLRRDYYAHPTEDALLLRRSGLGGAPSTQP